MILCETAVASIIAAETLLSIDGTIIKNNNGSDTHGPVTGYYSNFVASLKLNVQRENVVYFHLTIKKWEFLSSSFIQSEMFVGAKVEIKASSAAQ